MTREEAITVIKALMENPIFCDEHKQAFNIAVHDIKQRHDWDINNLILINKDDYEPLEQEPCEDAVSRKSVITIIQNHWWNCRDIDKLVNELPSITPIRPKGHWIETAEEYYKAVNEKGGGVNENTDYFTDDIACSECLAKFSVIDNEAERFDFCPCCGSDNR